MNIRIVMFRNFRIEIDGHNINLSKRESELMALLAAAGGKKITAKNYWEIVVKQKKCLYSAKFYSSASRQLCQTLAKHGAEKAVETGLEPVRFCRINMDEIKCDYYEMLDGKTEILGKESFLPDYMWASDFYCQSWAELNRLLDTNPLFEY